MQSFQMPKTSSDSTQSLEQNVHAIYSPFPPRRTAAGKTSRKRSMNLWSILNILKCPSFLPYDQDGNRFLTVCFTQSDQNGFKNKEEELEPKQQGQRSLLVTRFPSLKSRPTFLLRVLDLWSTHCTQYADQSQGIPNCCGVDLPQKAALPHKLRAQLNINLDYVCLFLLQTLTGKEVQLPLISCTLQIGGGDPH